MPSGMTLRVTIQLSLLMLLPACWSATIKHVDPGPSSIVPFASLAVLAPLPDGLAALCRDGVCAGLADCTCRGVAVGRGVGALSQVALLLVARGVEGGNDIHVVFERASGWVLGPLVSASREVADSPSELGAIDGAMVASDNNASWAVIVATNTRRETDRASNREETVSAKILTMCGALRRTLGCVQVVVACSRSLDKLDEAGADPRPSVYGPVGKSSWSLRADLGTIGEVTLREGLGPLSPEVRELLGHHTLQQLASTTPTVPRALWLADD